MHLGIPQIIYLILIFIGLGNSMANHGKSRKNENAWTSIIGISISLTLLYFGGFFK